MSSQAIEPTRDPVPTDPGHLKKVPVMRWIRSEEKYLSELKRPSGKAFQKRSRREYKSVMAIYFEELLNELKTGVEVWLPHQIGMVQLCVRRTFLPTRRQGQAKTDMWFHALWRKRDGIRYPAMFQFKVSKDEGYRLKLYYDKHPEELMKLKQL